MMKHNQFKSFINNYIKNEAHTFDFTVMSIDYSNNQRMIYIYTLDYVCVGVFNLWLNNEYVHLSFSKETVTSINWLAAKQLKSNYTSLNTVLDFITKCVAQLDEENW